MSTLQAFTLGAMIVWTPSLIYLAYWLRRASPIDKDRSPASEG